MQNLAGQTNLKELCFLLKKASLFVGVDSGVMHLASSFDIPVVGIFGPTDPFYLGPQNKRSRVVKENMECSPCNLKGCDERACMKNLDAQKVLEACEELLLK
jgi:ADP-heptose:LPS heptosyltransferase